MQEKLCKYCGLPFKTNSGTKIYCDRDHYAICIVCGKEFKINNSYINDIRKTCSRKCSNVLRKKTCVDKYGGNAPASSPEVIKKMKDTLEEHYGVRVPMHSSQIQEKVRCHNQEKYGSDWYFESEDYLEKLKKTSLEKYGTEYPVQSKEVKDKIKKTNIEKYGVECVFASPEIRNKIHQDYYDKTGYYEPFANPDVILKSEATWKEKYGTKRPLQSEEVKETMRRTFLNHYGVDNPLKDSDIRENIKRSNMEKYGYEYTSQIPEMKERVRRTMVERYSHRYYSQTREWKESMMRDPSKVDNLIKFRENPILYIQSHFDHKPSYKEIVYEIGTSEGLVDTLEKFNCIDMIDYVFSYMEREVKEALISIDSSLNLQINTKRIITPYEIDIYLPDYKLGIECNPTATHNSSFNMQHGRKDTTPTNYHQMKSDLCENKGIFLFHIFGPDWEHRRDVIISMLRNILGKNKDKIYARKTQIHVIDSYTSSKFLNENHRQGNANASIKLGLFYEDNLVSVMTFGKLRNTIGSGKDDTSQVWELVRFCNLMNTSVVGGASKLFKYFIDEYHPEEIRSFSDRAHTRGNLYKTLGFHELRRSSAGYVWVDYKTDIPYHRINAQKQNIRKFLKDDSIDIENQTEIEIMEDHGFVQLFDSGTITWQWKSS